MPANAKATSVDNTESRVGRLALHSSTTMGGTTLHGYGSVTANAARACGHAREVVDAVALDALEHLHEIELWYHDDGSLAQVVSSSGDVPETYATRTP